ncbi:MAG TPA: nuclear transport factor 2 family protein [Frankiaceae bacterium]|jgi:ketosteroid isomerase-like protein|nr:nuclear transport factor 2 family protein [Frankiaceae bacterium]
MTDAKALATTYFRAWKDKDFAALRSVLADDVTFTGPMGTANGVDECLQGLEGMSKQMEDIVLRVMVADGSDVITWYDLKMQGVDPLPTANWSHVEDGRIAEIRATFDPRKLFEASN